MKTNKDLYYRMVKQFRITTTLGISAMVLSSIFSAILIRNIRQKP